MKKDKCKACHEFIYWVKTTNGKNMPVNIKKEVLMVHDPEQDVYKMVYGYAPHWGTCPAADKFKKRDKPKDFIKYIRSIRSE